MKRIRTSFLLAITILLTACAASTSEPTQIPTPSGPVSIPVSPQDLTGVWVRVLTSSPNPDKTGHFWLKLEPDGRFVATTNRMSFDGDVEHRGQFSFEGNIITFNAGPGSLACEGQSASYQVTKYEDGSMELITSDVPCEEWLSMGEGKLGEGTIWVRPNE